MTRTEILDTLANFHRSKGDEYQLRRLGLFGSAAREPVNPSTETRSMSDPALAREILRQIHEATERVLWRFEPIERPEDFTSSESGLEKLDAICMQLIAIGEAVKNLDKVTDGELLPKYPSIEWKRVMGIRDVLSHHYFDRDPEVVYSVCKNHIGLLRGTVQERMESL